jgi:ribosomal protein L32E
MRKKRKKTAVNGEWRKERDRGQGARDRGDGETVKRGYGETEKRRKFYSITLHALRITNHATLSLSRHLCHTFGVSWSPLKGAR